MAIGWMILGLINLALSIYVLYAIADGKYSMPGYSKGAEYAMGVGELLLSLLWVYAAYTETKLLAYMIIASALLGIGSSIYGGVRSHAYGGMGFGIALGLIMLYLGYQRLNAVVPAVVGARRR